MNEFLKKIVVLTEELITADGFHSLIIINDMELEYAKHIKEILGQIKNGCSTTASVVITQPAAALAASISEIKELNRELKKLKR